MLASLGSVGRVGRMGLSGRAALVGRPSLALDFMQPGTLDSRITFTRASTATYTDASGTIQTAAIDQPRWDYAGGVLRGLLIEEARTNLWLRSADASDPTWVKNGNIVAIPTVTANQTISPDGALTAARVAFPAVSGAGAYSQLSQSGIAATANAYSFSVWLRGSAGGEQFWLSATPDGVLYYRTLVTLTTSWQRFVVTTPVLTATTWYFQMGVDLRDAGETSKPAQTVFIWGGQLEQGGFPTSYIPTTTATVTRAQDLCAILPANMTPWFTTTGSWLAEWIFIDPAPDGRRIIGAITTVGGGITPLTASTNPYQLGQWDGASFFSTTNSIVSNIVQKGANTSTGAGPAKLCLNGGPISNTVIGTGFAALGTSGVRFLQTVTGPSPDGGSGYIRHAQFWPRVLSDAEMQAATA